MDFDLFQNNSTYVIRDNEGRWFLLQTNAAAGTTASESRVHQVSSATFSGTQPFFPYCWIKRLLQTYQNLFHCVLFSNSLKASAGLKKDYSKIFHAYFDFER